MGNGEITRWYCVNRDCCWFEETNPAFGGGEPPRCRCGALMREERLPVVFTYLDFLCTGDSLQDAARAEKE